MIATWKESLPSRAYVHAPNAKRSIGGTIVFVLTTFVVGAVLSNCDEKTHQKKDTQGRTNDARCEEELAKFARPFGANPEWWRKLPMAGDVRPDFFDLEEYYTIDFERALITGSPVALYASVVDVSKKGDDFVAIFAMPPLVESIQLELAVSTEIASVILSKPRDRFCSFRVVAEITTVSRSRFVVTAHPSGPDDAEIETEQRIKATGRVLGVESEESFCD